MKGRCFLLYVYVVWQVKKTLLTIEKGRALCPGSVFPLTPRIIVIRSARQKI